MGYDSVTVLVVEDEVLVRMDIVRSLENDGFDVLEASNADEAIILLNAHPEVRLMFTDIDMPGSMDGLKLATAVRDRWPPVKIIVTSGHREMRTDASRWLDDFLISPTIHQELSRPYEK